MKTNFKRSLVFCAVSLATGFGSQTLAQQESQSETAVLESEGYSLDEIIVTATRVEESILQVPVAVTAVSGEILEQNNVSSIENLAELVPSLTYTQSSSDQNTSLQIRGIGTSVFSPAVEPSVSFILDGVVLGRQAQGLQDLVDIERVEVLRGPQSTLFGKNASAGVINVVTSDPSKETEGVLSLLAAEGGELHAKGAVSGSLSENVSARFSAFYKERDGHIENVFDGRDLNGFESKGARLKLLYQPSDDFSLLLTADYRDSEAECCIYQARDLSTALNPAQAALVRSALGAVVPGEENTQTNAGSDIFNNTDQSGLSATAELSIGNYGTLTSITAYRDWNFNNNLDVDGVPGESATLGVVQINTNSNTTSTEQFTQELRYAWNDGGRLSYVVGAYYFDLDLQNDFKRRLTAFVPAFGRAIFQSGGFRGNVDTTNLSVFGEANYKLTDKLGVVIGARYIDEELDYGLFRGPSQRIEPGDFPLGGPSGVPIDVSGIVSDTAVTGRFGFKYNISEDSNAYITYSRGYKGATYNVGFTGTEADVPLDPETSDAIELGLKAFFFDRKLQINSALFTTEFSGFQAQAAVPGELQVVLVNAGEVETSGFETEFTALISPSFTLSGGLTYTDGEITEFPFGQCYPGQTEAQGCIAGSQNLAGGVLPDVAELKYSISGRYQRGLGGSAWDGFVQVGYQWQDDIQFALTQDPRTIQDAYGVANLSFGLVNKQAGYNLSFFVRNVFDESYTNNIFGTPLVNGATSHYIPREAERYIGGTFTYSF